MAVRWPTIRDVAARAGVSVSTASKALNNKGEIAQETRLRVQAVAKEMNFTPNALIRSLQRGRTNTIGLFGWVVRFNSGLEITVPVMKGIADVMAENGRDLLMYASDQTTGPKSAGVLLDGRVDGVLLGPDTLALSDIGGVARAGLPAVVMYRSDPPPGFGYVALDNEGGARQAVDHLAALGHRRIAFYATPTPDDFVRRRNGYHQALEAHGIPADPALSIVMDEYEEPVRPVCERLLALPDPPTAVITGNDVLAARWIAALTDCGLRVPDDFSVIGFDDAPGAAPLQLTTIRQPAEEVGSRAAQLVDRLIGGALANECRVTLPLELVVRGTAGPVKR